MASGFRREPNTTSAQLKSSTSSVTSVSSIRSSLSSSASNSTRMKTAKAAVDASTENDLVKEIYEQFLNCKLCLKPFLRPKTLNCLHTFCEECLVKYKDAELEGSRYISYSMRSKLSCPTCTKKTDLPPGGVKRLQDSFLLSSLNQVIARVSQNSKSSPSGSFSQANEGDAGLEERLESGKTWKKVWCGICSKGSVDDQMFSSFLSSNSNTADNQTNSSRPSKKNQKSIVDPVEHVSGTLRSLLSAGEETEARKEAAVECLDCSAKLLCRDCALMHKSTEVTQNHSLVDIDLARQGKLLCVDHPQETVRFYCESCDKCVCILCTFNDHKTHRIVTFSESVKTQIQTLETRLWKCRKTFDTMKDHLNVISHFETKVAAAESLIRERSNELVKLIKEEEEKSLSELKAVIQNDEVASFLEQKPHFEQMLTDMEGTLNTAESLLKTRSVEIILTKKKMDQEMKHMLEWTSRNVPERLTGPLVFEPRIIELRLGVLRTEESDNITRRSSSFDGRSSENFSDVVESGSSTSDKDSSGGELKRDSSFSPTPDSQEVEILRNETISEIKDEICSIAQLSSDSSDQDVATITLSNVDKTRDNETLKHEEHSHLKSECDTSTTTDIVDHENRSTSTIFSLQTASKATSTDILSTSEKGVVTVATHVSSVYKDFLDAKTPKSVMVSRGTMTFSGDQQDRASSPVRIICLDKSTMANKAELAEPKDVFCRPGLEGKPKKIIENIPASARLDSINEGSDEDKSSGEDTKGEQKLVVNAKVSKVNSPKLGNRFVPSKPLPSFATQRSIAPNSAIVYPLAPRRPGSGLGDKLRINGNKPLPAKRYADVGTNTEVVTFHEKAVATEVSRDQTIVGCINILKTVRNRMESIPSPGSLSMDNSEANLALSKISEPSSSIASSFEADKGSASFINLNETTEGCFSVRDVKKYILSVDAGAGTASNMPEESLVKKFKSYHSPALKRQKTPGPGQSADGSNSSGKSSTNNSPGLQRSGKAVRAVVETSTSSKSPKLMRAKVKSTQDSVRTSKQKQAIKHSPGLTDLSDSLHSESSEEYDRCGSGESFAGVSACTNLDGDRSFVASLRQRLVGSPISGRRQKTELPKVLNPTNKSPRPHRKF